jgi:carboxyl-terminal processing protease
MWRLVLLVACLLAGPLAISPVSPTYGADVAGVSPIAKRHEAFIRREFAIADLVLRHHVEPPTRQEMFLAGIRAAWNSLDLTPPADLSQRISDLKSPAELGRLLDDIDEHYRHLTDSAEPIAPPPGVVVLMARLFGPAPSRPSGEELDLKFQKVLEAAFEKGMLASVPGSLRLVPAKRARAEAQLQSNLYVGIGIAVQSEIGPWEQSATVATVVPDGPAEKGGIKVGDHIEQVDQTTVTAKLDSSAVVELLRGEEGTRVTIRVRQPGSKSRTVSLLRRTLNIQSVQGIEPDQANNQGSRPDPKLPIAYLQVSRISASTVHELRRWEPRLRAAGIKGLILDLRSYRENEIDGHHFAMLLADKLVVNQPLGNLRTRTGSRAFISQQDCLFRDWPLAVLVNERTAGAPEWVAAALQDFGRAIVVGAATAGDNFANSAIDLLGGKEALIVGTGVVERPDSPAQLRDAHRKEGVTRWRVNPDIVAADSNEERLAVFAGQSPANLAGKRSPVLEAAIQALQRQLGIARSPEKTAMSR